MIKTTDFSRDVRHRQPWHLAFMSSLVVAIGALTGHAAGPVPQEAPVPEPVIENAPAKAELTFEAYEPARDRPFGIGRITIPVATEEDWKWYRDQPACVRSSDGKISYQAFRFQRSENDSGSAAFTAWFLLPQLQTKEITISVSAGDKLLVKDCTIEIQPYDAENSSRCLHGFWLAFNENRSLSPSPELEAVNEYLRSMLARRMKFEPLATTISPDSTSEMERQFERSVGMLFGFTSVRLAMMELEPLSSQDYQQEAFRPLPPAMQIRSAPINSYETREPEPLAMHVPQECLYFRFPSVKHYLWVRELIQGWGGSLDEVVAVPAVDAQVRSRIEKQLAFDPLKAVERDIDAEIIDSALIALDTYFNEGAAVGIVFRAKAGGNLSAILNEQRQAVSRENDVTSETVRIGVGQGHFVSTKNNQVRSFYVRDGQYHLLTNSRKLAERFLETRQQRNSLGSLKEYRYALTHLNGQTRYAGVLYLSDPFFRNITSPAYRIEVERRRHAAREIQILKLAMAAARAEGILDHDIPQFIENGFLPGHFGHRPDESQATVDLSGNVIDSSRGAAGSFVPIADVDVNLVTSAEHQAYIDFTRAYRREWRTVDPVLLTIAGKPDTDGKLDKVVVDVRITPYAREEYGVLARYLPRTPMSKTLGPAEGELLGLSLPLSGYPSAFLRFGLIDDDVEWEMKSGEIIRSGAFKNRSFAERNSYVLLTPFNRNVVNSAMSLAESLQDRNPGSTPLSTPQNRSTGRSRRNSPFMTDLLLALITGNPMLLFRENVEPLDLIGEQEKYVRSQNSDVVKTVNQSFGFEHGNRSAHVFMQMKGVKESKVFPYLEAVTWAESRRRSAADTAVLNRLSADWSLSPQDARSLIENVLAAKLACPTGGEYRLIADGPATQPEYWNSSLWLQPSLYSETSVPDKYDFSFLSWLRGFALDATLDVHNSTLSSHLELDLFDPPEMPAFPDVTPGQDEPGIAPGVRENGTLIVNRTDRPLQYRCRKISGVWSKWYTLPANRAHRFRVDYSLEFEYQMRHIRQRALVRSNQIVEFNEQTGKLQVAR